MPTIRFNTHFPGYEVLSELGRSNARILKARHLATGDLVAIKHFALNTDAETLRRFQQESQIMTSISHPTIVRVRDVQLEAEMPFIVMDLIEGGSLKNLLAQSGTLDIPTFVRLGLQMASALKLIHEKGIIHRDIKPENILYRPLSSGELHFLLTDFGVARLHERSTTLTGQSLLTYEYASPEQFNDPRNVGPATDFYSLGVVLYEALFGKVPFALEGYAGIAAFMNSVLTETPPALAGGTVEGPLQPFVEIVSDLLEKDPNRRLSDADEMVWRIKQAELTHLQTSRKKPADSDVKPVSATVQSPVKPSGPQPLPVGRKPVDAPKPGSTARSGWTKALLFLLIAGIVGVGGYYAFKIYKQEVVPEATETSIDSGLVLPAEAVAEDVEDTIKQREEEEARKRQQLILDARKAVGRLSAEVIDYKVGIFGGIKDIRVQLENPSSLAFTTVTVQLNYYKEKGGLFKTEKLYFNQVGPQSTLILSAPASNRGTRLSCSVIGHQYPKEIDSLLTAPETQPER